MGKASRIKQQSAREKIAAQREAARKAERRNRIMITGGSTVIVLVVVLAFIVIKLTQGSASAGGGDNSVTGSLLPASVASQVTGVPAATLDKVGKGAVPTFTQGQPALTAGSGAALTSGGKPQMLYIGAEFCPYCAAMRWSMAIALSRFGTLSPLHGIHSSSTDTDPNTATLTFYKTGYTSKYLDFTPVEIQTVSRGPLQNPDQRAERGLGQVRAGPEHPRLPVHRLRQQACAERPHLRRRGAAGQVVEPDRRGR